MRDDVVEMAGMDLQGSRNCRPFGERDDRRSCQHQGSGACSPTWSWSVHRRAMSTTTTMWAAFRASRWKSCSSSSPPTTSAGRRRWPPRSWAIPDRPELSETLTPQHLLRDRPRHRPGVYEFTFLSDNRDDLRAITARTLVLQCREDIIAPICCRRICPQTDPGSRFMLLSATGHCPNLSAPTK